MNKRRFHEHIESVRGKACIHQCSEANCDNQADEWSWTQNTNRNDIFNYEARCIPCHRKYDLTGNSNAFGHTVSDDARSKMGHPGSKSGTAKLVDSEVIAIRAMAADGWERIDLANMYGVTTQLIGDIIRRKRWSHI